MSELTEYFDDIRAITAKAEPLVAVLEVAQAATGIGGAGAAAALKVIEAALRVLAESVSGAMTHEQFQSQIAGLHAALASDEASEDAALQAKFPGPLPA